MIVCAWCKTFSSATFELRSGGAELRCVLCARACVPLLFTFPEIVHIHSGCAHVSRQRSSSVKDTAMSSELQVILGVNALCVMNVIIIYVYDCGAFLYVGLTVFFSNIFILICRDETYFQCEVLINGFEKRRVLAERETNQNKTKHFVFL